MNRAANAMPISPEIAPPSNPEPAAPLSLLQSTEQAFALAGQGNLQIIELLNAVQQLTEAKQADIAISLYQIWLERSVSPLAYAVQFNLGVLLGGRDDAGAETAYRASIVQNPAFVESYINLASLLERTQRTDEALATWRTALSVVDTSNPLLYCQLLNNLGRLLELRNEWPEAEAMLALSLKQDATQTKALTHWLHLRQKLCAWPIHDATLGISYDDMLAASSALAILSASDDPAVQLAASQRYVDEKVLKDVRQLCARLSYGHKRLRIGYLSSDFCAHAVSILTAELYGLHDRSQVEVFGFCWSKDDGSAMRTRVIAGFDHHIKIGELSDEQAAQLIRTHEIDVLVDLHGLTLGARHDILSYRPAPVQLTWLGLPGTTALPEVDYVIADPFVLPPALAPFFTEKPLHMPLVFQVNDRQRVIGAATDRAQCGLPEDAFVFCCFSNNFKFTPEVFEAWMRIILRVPNSVMWLVADSDAMRENLCLHAEKCGVPRERLIFADRLLPAEHLARLQVADLFLDTYPFGSGATASDALWAGLPLLAYTGQTFASRMAGSLLHAVSLPELITSSLQEYEDKAITLAENRPRIEAMKQLLTQQRQLSPLFDTLRFARDLEALYRQLIDALPARTMQSSFDAALGHANVTRAVSSTSDRRYVIVAPPFQHNSAGIRVLYDLQKWLVLAGLDAIVCTWFQGYPVDQFEDDIVIYPEVAPGNILKAKRIIRYVLNVPGKLGYGEKSYGKNEVLICYNQELASFADGAVLQVPSIEAFFNAVDTHKTCNAVFVGKGVNLGLHPADCIEITKTYPSTRREMAKFLRSVKTLYAYDDFSMIGQEARVCGCEVRLIKNTGEMTDYPNIGYPTMDEFKAQLHAFIEMTKRL